MQEAIMIPGKVKCCGFIILERKKSKITPDFTPLSPPAMEDIVKCVNTLLRREAISYVFLSSETAAIRFSSLL